MIKRIFIVFVVVAIAFGLGVNLHEYALALKKLTLTFSLIKVYVFFAITAIVVCVISEYLINKTSDYVGFFYLFSMFFKIGAFVVIFYNLFFSGKELLKYEKLSILLPMFLFLIIEATIISKRLNKL